jgi:hypothetical protein
VVVKVHGSITIRQLSNERVCLLKREHTRFPVRIGQVPVANVCRKCSRCVQLQRLPLAREILVKERQKRTSPDQSLTLTLNGLIFRCNIGC